MSDPTSDRDEFVAWVRGPLREADIALHNGDAARLRALWSRREPLSVLGAWGNAIGQTEVGDLFALLGSSFRDCTRYDLELLAYDVHGDMAYTVAFEHTDVLVDGQPRSYTLRASQVYRREDGGWRVAHRHADTLSIRPAPGTAEGGPG